MTAIRARRAAGRLFAAAGGALLLAACQTAPPREPVAEETAPAPTVEETYRSYCLQASMQDVPGHQALGYGSGPNLRSALGRAYQDLAEKLEVAVDATTISTRRRDRAGDIEQELREHVETRAATELSDVERICLDQNDPDGDTHVAVRVDLRSPATIAATELAQLWGGVPERIDWQAPAALRESPFLRALQRSLADQPRRSGHMEARLSLYQRADRWQLEVNGNLLSTGDTPLAEFIDWQANARGDLDLRLVNEDGRRLRSQIRDGDEFRVRMQGGSAGFLTLLTGDGNGGLSALRENMPLNGTLLVPSPPGIFSAAIDVPGEPSRMHFVALLADETISIAPHLAPAGAPGDPQSFLAWLEQQAFDVAVTEILVTPR